MELSFPVERISPDTLLLRRTGTLTLDDRPLSTRLQISALVHSLKSWRLTALLDQIVSGSHIIDKQPL